MLYLITGRDRITLSQHIFSEIYKKADEGCAGQILVVPEQFSHESERRLCLIGGDTISRFAEVLTPSRLADRVLSYSDGIAHAFLDHGGRLLAMALAAEQVSSRIKLYAAVLRKPEFLTNMITIVEEFQSYCLLPETLRQAAEHADGQFAQKLEELSILYEAYLAVCANGKADPAEKLFQLSALLETTDWASGKTFYFDGFGDFTGAEFSILEQLILQADDVWVAVQWDTKAAPCSSLSSDTVHRIMKYTTQQDIPVCRMELHEHAQRHPAVQALLDHLFISDYPYLPPSDRIHLAAYQSIDDECRSAVLYVKKLLHDGARCRDIAIACADGSVYDVPLRAALQMAEIDAYYAGREDVLNKPIFQSILCALQTVVGQMDYEDVSAYLKSGLPLLDRDVCDRLDVYAFRWNIRGSQWEKPWEHHPRGFGEVWEKEDYEALEKLNAQKELAFSPLFRLRNALLLSKNTGQMVLACHAFLEEIQLRQRLEDRANLIGGQSGLELVQIYDILCDSLEQTWLILGDTVRSCDDFVRLYRTVLSEYHISTIPAGVDQVYVGSLQDLRSKCVPNILVLGTTDGSFPSYKTGEGLLTEEERKTLLNRGIALAPTRADQIEREISQIYSALSSATERVWFSYSGDLPAWLYRRAAALYPMSVHSENNEIFLDTQSYAAWRLRHEDTSTVKNKDIQKWEENLRKLRDYQFSSLDEKMVHGLYGKKIYLSASRIDKYASCRFAFFLAYGLKAQPRKQAKLDASAFGTFVHEVLEKTVIRVNQEGGFHQVQKERLMMIATEEINAYAAIHFPQQAQRDAYLFHRSESEIMDIVLDLGEELRTSMFEPVSCELEFSESGEMPAVEIEGSKTSCKISGFVDRVDLYEVDGISYVRVVDYKTGHKDFDYTDILNGAGLQMLIYLFALKSHGGVVFGKEMLHPAGVLYLPARKEYTLTDPLPDDETVDAEHRNERKRRGLISARPELLAAMELDPEKPRFMPYRVGKNGYDGNLADDGQMLLLERHVVRTLKNMADQIGSGTVRPNPIFRGQDSSCRFCDFRDICHMDLCERDIRPMASTSAEKFWEKLKQEDDCHG